MLGITTEAWGGKASFNIGRNSVILQRRQKRRDTRTDIHTQTHKKREIARDTRRETGTRIAKTPTQTGTGTTRYTYTIYMMVNTQTGIIMDTQGYGETIL